METTTQTPTTSSRPALRGNRGQVIALYAIALPVLLGVMALALDGGKLFVSKIHVQNAADAAALASSQDVGPCGDGSCAGLPAEITLRTTVEQSVNSYSSNNGGPPALGQCVAPWYAENASQRHVDPVRDPTKPTGCYTWPYINGPTPADVHWDKVEVRIRKPVNLSFASIVGFHNPAYPFARSVGAYQPALLITSTPGTTVLGYSLPGQTHTYVFSGQTRTTTDPDTTVVNTTTNSTFSGGNGGVAFVKGTDCLSAPAGTDWPGDPGGASVQWQGAPSAWTSFITNGGLTVNGANAHTAAEIWVGKHKVSGCEQYQGGWKVTGPPPGSTPCSASGTPASTCPYIHGAFSPLDWPLPPPSPAPPAGCLPTGTAGISGGWTATHPPGVYCYTAGALTLSANGATFDGYSFYAPSISATSNGMIFNPSLTCGTRRVLFDAYAGDINLGGNSDQLKGDMYATNGKISVTGGGSFAGCGFMETLKLMIGGNFAGYQGTGPGAGGGIVTTTTVSTTTVPGGTHTTTDPNTTSFTTDPDTVVPDSVSTGATFTATTGTNIGLGE